MSKKNIKILKMYYLYHLMFMYSYFVIKIHFIPCRFKNTFFFFFCSIVITNGRDFSSYNKNKHLPDQMKIMEFMNTNLNNSNYLFAIQYHI